MQTKTEPIEKRVIGIINRWAKKKGFKEKNKY